MIRKLDFSILCGLILRVLKNVDIYWQYQTKPFDNQSYELRIDKHCLIYVHNKDSVEFVKHKIIKYKDLKEEQFPRLIKYAAGMVHEEDYEVVFGDIKKSNQEWKIDWIKQEKIFGELLFCLVCPKNQD